MSSKSGGLRTPLGRVRFLGSSHKGTGETWIVHLTGMAQRPARPRSSSGCCSTFCTWTTTACAPPSASPIAAILLLAFILAGIVHMEIGMRSIIVDYVQGHAPRPGADREHLFAALLGLACVYATLRIELHLTLTSSRTDYSHMATNGSPAESAPALGGKAYPITDHTYDVVVVGAGGAGLRASRRLRPGRPQDRLHLQGVPDPLAHRRRAGRHFGLARQHGPGRLALAHVRHRQGVGLARRPGRDRVPVPQRAGRRLRARPLGRAVLAHRRGQDLPAPVRRHDDRLRQGHRAAHLRRRRPHRPRDPAHALRPGAQGAAASSSSSISPST